jgi:hypothetical protein
MSMLVHVTRASANAQIRKAGIRAARCNLVTASGPQALRGVFVFPVLDNFAATFQWVRELRQFHDERALAVYVRGNDDEEVLVGRYGQSHQETSLGEAIRWVRAHPWGAQITLLRSVRAREVHAIRAITQLVGWVGAPHDTKLPDCVCAVCLPPGSRDIGRRVRASFQQHVRRAREATEPSEISAALRGTELALERLGAKVGIKPLLAFAKHPDAQVRRITAWVLGICRSDTTVADQLARMTQDTDEQVAAEAARALLGVAGRTRFLRAAETMSEAALLEAIDDLRYVADARSILERLPRTAPAVQRRIDEVLTTL